MSERKVLNKYYPPDFDPSKIPRMKLPKNRQYTVRLMAPFNMRCQACGEYIYRGKKFNARKEDVENEDYCGIRIYRFYIKCTRCLQEISFKTDPQNTDYVIEAGATRNFMALKLAQEQEKREEEELKEEEANNPMTLLENRTQQSKMELELMESLEELKELNRRHYNTDFNQLLQKYGTGELKQKLEQLQEEKDEMLIKKLMSKKKVIAITNENPISDTTSFLDTSSFPIPDTSCFFTDQCSSKKSPAFSKFAALKSVSKTYDSKIKTDDSKTKSGDSISKDDSKIKNEQGKFFYALCDYSDSANRIQIKVCIYIFNIIIIGILNK